MSQQAGHGGGAARALAFNDHPAERQVGWCARDAQALLSGRDEQHPIGLARDIAGDAPRRQALDEQRLDGTVQVRAGYRARVSHQYLEACSSMSEIIADISPGCRMGASGGIGAGHAALSLASEARMRASAAASTLAS